MHKQFNPHSQLLRIGPKRSVRRDTYDTKASESKKKRDGQRRRNIPLNRIPDSVQRTELNKFLNDDDWRSLRSTDRENYEKFKFDYERRYIAYIEFIHETHFASVAQNGPFPGSHNIDRVDYFNGKRALQQALMAQKIDNHKLTLQDFDTLNIRYPETFGTIMNATRLKSDLIIPDVLPEWLSRLSNMEYIDLSDATNLTNLPESIGLLTNLKVLVLNRTNIIRLPESIGDCKSLEVLDLSQIPNITTLPRSFVKLHNSLKKLLLPIKPLVIDMFIWLNPKKWHEDNDRVGNRFQIALPLALRDFKKLFFVSFGRTFSSLETFGERDEDTEQEIVKTGFGDDKFPLTVGFFNIDSFLPEDRESGRQIKDVALLFQDLERFLVPSIRIYDQPDDFMIDELD